jgi:thiol-disulfide isomerase/thioredoxin
MKQLIFFFAASLSFGNFSNAQTLTLHPFTLEGNIKGKDSGYVYLNYIPDGNMGITDSCEVKKGYFVFKGNIAEPTKAFFSTFNNLNPNDIYDETDIEEFYIEPTKMKLSAKINQFRTLQLTGSVSQDEKVKLEKLKVPIDKIIQPIEDSMNRYGKQYRDLKKNKSDSATLKIALQKWNMYTDSAILIYKRKYILDSTFIIENPNSYVAADMLSRASVEWIAFPSLESLYVKLPERIKQSFPGQKIKYEIDKGKYISVGSLANNFIATDSKGDTIRLADYKGKKYVLLDFGASWCSPCRHLIPELKKEYDKYDTALEIISIANQDQEEDWRKAIADDKMEWPQIIENKKMMPIEPSGKTITDMYYVDGIPALILIDKNLKIIGKYGGFYGSKYSYFLDLKKELNKIIVKN